MAEPYRLWDIDRAVERHLDNLYADLDRLVRKGELTDADVLNQLTRGWSDDIAEGYREWIKEGE